ncbi:MAG: 50S ribosomal protein L9 [Candidatus Lloydbacteria bacterium RIFCSPHIGHO2_02_FULL_51_22]|uniref:Large ribosomal subunit protein bL9 n=3 Tax=Candidatus Lloydiibacteriota TaxID=1817910 RepID=A0A1G2DFJ0_9BACT|nr:MAG: 50S ribosomal protein L9 [Candidatus Lloydbacteria bacterium RIFCSPHIGHO2_02_FULL_51_22]OGZ15291.1 MAG: 50S ribosomal protein L9 [Candidatus Lloydbacteria bacterium RIFCSPLOWO2_02_FULL_51_11]OGZ16328.1 MAG: 50S ribosomal protein L9 [Candidatus Lloydbacteria bacterium RIFCSPLOWO2_12_FULL_51_9]
MKIILKENIRGVGKKYEVKDVADGYARNFLIARNKAEYATPRAILSAQNAFAEQEKAREEEAVAEKAVLGKLEGTVMRITANANEQGSLFAGIGKEQIVTALKEKGLKGFSRESFDMKEPIKTLGKHIIPLLLDGARAGDFVLEVERE